LGCELKADLPGEVGPDGPRKEVIWQTRAKLPVHLAVFPDLRETSAFAADLPR
jgi:hypothetical protein